MSQQLAGPAVNRGRFQLLDRPVVHPGKCAPCGASDRPVIDFGFDLEEYGTVYFCITCLREIATGPLRLVDAREAEVARLTATNAVAQRDKAATILNEYVERIHNLYNTLIADLSNLPGVVDPRSEAVPTDSDRQRLEKVRDNKSSQPSISESFSLEGSPELPTDNGDGPESIFKL